MDRVRYYSPGLLIPTHYLTHLKLEDSVTASQYRPIPDPHKPAFYGLEMKTINKEILTKHRKK